MAALSPAARTLAWCAAGTIAAYFVIARISAGNPDGFSAIFWYLLSAYDAHGNMLLLAVAVGAFLLRENRAALAPVAFAAERPWTVALLLFPLLCLGSLRVYHDHPLSMDEYAPLFQAQAFAAGALSGSVPVDLIDRVVPPIFQNMFLSISRDSGRISSTYWPGFALLLTPFAWLGAPWAANPAIGALTIPAIHRLASSIAGTREAGGWAVMLTAASPVFIVASISYYSLPAHLLCNLVYALLLLRPTVARAFAAGLIGSFALVLHNPVPHLLFSAAFIVWLLARRSFAAFAALAAGYLPLCALLGVGWQRHLADLGASGPSGAEAAARAPLTATVASYVESLISIPSWQIFHARLAGLSKLWTWSAAALVVFAAQGFALARKRVEIRLLGAALVTSFFGYFLVRFDQGHGWGYRYLHAAWFVLPLLGAVALGGPQAVDGGLKRMAGWAAVLSLLAIGLRLAQVDSFIGKHRDQVPPLARAPSPGTLEIVFVDAAAGRYALDLVQNDPFLRGARITMVYRGPEDTANLMRQRFPSYHKSAEGRWGELWARPQQAPAN